MPGKSKAQITAARIALAAKHGDIAVSDLTGSAKEMYNSMSASELDKIAKTKMDSLPYKVKKTKK